MMVECDDYDYDSSVGGVGFSYYMLSVEAALLVIAFISLPNLFHRAEFNVPLLLFAAVSWRNRMSTCAYLIIISWGIDLYRIVTLVSYED